MGKRSDFERKPRDYYDTPYEAVIPLASHLPKSFTFVEPCAGNSCLRNHLVSFGGSCMGQYDTEPQNSTVMKMDAKHLSNLHAGAADFIITNPPWDRSKRSGYLLHKLIEVFANLRPTWLLIDSDWHDTKQSGKLLDDYCTKIVPIGRVKWFGNMTGKDNCSWYMFDKNKWHDYISPVIEFYPRV
jgi:hypothetical protein